VKKRKSEVIIMNLMEQLQSQNNNIFAVVMHALKENSELCSLLAEGNKSIYHLLSPDAGTYPILVVSIPSDVPECSSDDSETLHKVTIRIHILTEDGAFTNIYNKINEIMTGLRFNRKYAIEFVEDNLFIKYIDYTQILDVKTI
jgi:hypothetical protein